VELSILEDEESGWDLALDKEHAVFSAFQRPGAHPQRGDQLRVADKRSSIQFHKGDSCTLEMSENVRLVTNRALVGFIAEIEF
jgi:hypothetical protein